MVDSNLAVLLAEKNHESISRYWYIQNNFDSTVL